MSQENLMQNIQKNTLQNLEKFQLPRDFPSEMHRSIAQFFPPHMAAQISPGIRKDTRRRLLTQVDKAINFPEEIDADERKNIYKVFVKIQKSYQQDGVNVTLQKIFALLRNNEEMRKKLVRICKADPALAACVMASPVLRSALPEHERGIYYKNAAARVLSKCLGLMLGMVAAILKTVLYVPQWMVSLIMGGKRSIGGNVFSIAASASGLFLFLFLVAVPFYSSPAKVADVFAAISVGCCAAIIAVVLLLLLFMFAYVNRIYGIKKHCWKKLSFM